MAELPEREFMGGQKSKAWTYLILMVVLMAVILAINLVWKNPTAAREGVKHVLGLPSYLLAAICFLVGTIVFWVGLKIETDWPEAFGAFLISGSVAAFEIMVGWSKLAIGGITVIPYLLPLFVFVLLLMYAMKKSV